MIKRSETVDEAELRLKELLQLIDRLSKGSDRNEMRSLRP